MELKANDIKLQHKASHCSSGNFPSRSCTGISIQGSFSFHSHEFVTCSDVWKLSGFTSLLLSLQTSGN